MELHCGDATARTRMRMKAGQLLFLPTFLFRLASLGMLVAYRFSQACLTSLSCVFSIAVAKALLSRTKMVKKFQG